MRYRVAAETPQLYEFVKEVLRRTATIKASSDRRRLLSVDDVPDEVRDELRLKGASVQPETFLAPDLRKSGTAA